MLTIVYLMLGLAFMGGLFWALTQITARQRKLNAELTRLEQLAAEVGLNAEAILDRVDERADRLNDLLARAEARVAQAPAAPIPDSVPAPVAEQAPPKQKRARKAPAPVPDPVAEAPAAQAPEAPAPTPIAKYQELKSAVWAMADQGKNLSEIAQALGVPRGEVQLLLNLRAKKVTA